MKTAKKLIALLLTLCMVLSLLPTAVFAEEPDEVASGACGETITWTLDSTGLLTLTGTGSTGNYEDSTSPLYPYADKITKVVVGEGITELGDFLFWSMSYLHEVTLPDTLERIGNSTFRMSGVHEVSCPDGLTQIGYCAFEMSGLKNIFLPQTLTTLSDYAFSLCEYLDGVYFDGAPPAFKVSDTTKGYQGFLNTITTIFLNEQNADSWEDYIFENFGGHLTWVLTGGEENVLLYPFTDLDESQYYFTPVIWAYANGITSGTTATTFSPNATCTRAQMIAFLWRALGKPRPEGKIERLPFTDVPDDSYYLIALIWAYQKGIVSGMTPDTFGPNLPVTRAQVVSFLKRLDGAEEIGGSCPFTDVPSTEYYYAPVVWAWENGIAAGTSDTTFAPNVNCTRGQIVCFLYRYFAAE